MYGIDSEVLKVSDNGRYFVDQKGDPVFWLGTRQWQLFREYTLDDWYQLDLELCEEPENWSGAMDISERDDLGTEITDTSGADWSEALEEFHSLSRNED